MKKQDKTAYVAPITEILCVKSEHVMIAGSMGEDVHPGGGGFDSKKGFFDDEDFIWDSHHDNQWEDDVLSLQRENE
jgi:hypothetical protein